MSLIQRQLFSFLITIVLTQWLPASSVLADTLALPAISAASTDGGTTSARFTLSITSDTSSNLLTTQQVLGISLALNPDPADVGRSGSIYVIFVKDNSLFLLGPDRRFTIWNGYLETLTPFAEQIMLNEVTVLDLLSGRLDNPGEYQVFIAYGAEDNATLDYTPSPAIFLLSAAAQSPLLDEALTIYKTELEDKLIQARCAACHVIGGLARNSALQFQRSMTGSALNNLSMLQSYMEIGGNSAETLLTKATGGNSHTGGQQISVGDDDYNTLSQVLALLEQAQANEGLAYSFVSGQQGESGTSTQSLLSSVTLEPREATLRRAMILFAGKAPTAEGLKAVRDGNDETLRTSLRALMSGQQFREFIVRASNDRLLTEGTETQPIDSNFANFPILRNLKYEIELDEGGADFFYGRLDTAAKRASGELIAHVIINERPYSEILTANYMMMNPLLNEVLGGTAIFPLDAGDDDFLPAKITEYYYNAELEVSEGIPIAGSKVLSRGTPIADYPHAGVLSDFAFLARYPTTATNRNRARARWTLYHFLGIDIEKSSQRPTDEAALSDRNNPTLNNPACTICHTVMDPVAAAFQNWDEFNFYSRNCAGCDSLDGFYKHPEDGSSSPYQQGDLWYRDMRAPGLFETATTSRDYTLRELAGLMVEETAFVRAAVQFWWPAIFGSKPVELPSVESDQGFAGKNAAFLAQQASIDEFTFTLEQQLNAKDMLVEMIMSPWFSAQSSTNYEFQAAQLEADLGAEQLLSPSQIAAKTMNLTGVYWRSNQSPDGSTYSKYDELSVLLGGIDSIAVTERTNLVTPSMMAILQSHAVETACPIVVKDLALPLAKRRLFLKVDETITPLSIALITVDVTSSSSTDWQEHKLAAQIPANGAEIKVSFTNPYCDYDGEKCLEQRVLYVDGLTLRHASGAEQHFEVTAPEIQISGGCHVHSSHSYATFYSECTMSLNLDLDNTDNFEIVAHLAAQQAPSKEQPTQATIEVLSSEDIMDAQTNNVLLIKQQIVDLFTKLHGKPYAIDSQQVQQTYSLFASALAMVDQSSSSHIYNCNPWSLDGHFFSDLLTPEELEAVRSPSPNGNYYEMNWESVEFNSHEITRDSTGVKRAWVAVIAYLLSHYDYLHE
jgi:hypothetical protein